MKININNMLKEMQLQTAKEYNNELELEDYDYTESDWPAPACPEQKDWHTPELI